MSHLVKLLLQDLLIFLLILAFLFTICFLVGRDALVLVSTDLPELPVLVLLALVSTDLPALVTTELPVLPVPVQPVLGLPVPCRESLALKNGPECWAWEEP